MTKFLPNITLQLDMLPSAQDHSSGFAAYLALVITGLIITGIVSVPYLLAPHLEGQGQVRGEYIKSIEEADQALLKYQNSSPSATPSPTETSNYARD